MNWLSTLLKVAGSQIPYLSAVVQWQSEHEMQQLDKRVRKLEDPISTMHEDVLAVTAEIHKSISEDDDLNLTITDEFYLRYERCFSVLHKRGLIECSWALNRTAPVAIRVVSPQYLLYICAKYEPESKMNAIVEALENCRRGEALSGHELNGKTGLPVTFINAFFSIYEQMGYGFCSRSIGESSYQSTTG